MYLVQKLFYCWLCAFIGLLLINSCASKNQGMVHLPIPDAITSITLQNTIKLHRQDETSPWYVDDKLADEEKVNQLITLLKLPCRAKYDDEAVNSVGNKDKVPFTINDNMYAIGQHQAISQTHYVYHKNDVYLCHESIKFSLMQSQEKWLAKD